MTGTIPTISMKEDAVQNGYHRFISSLIGQMLSEAIAEKDGSPQWLIDATKDMSKLEILDVRVGPAGIEIVTADYTFPIKCSIKPDACLCVTRKLVAGHPLNKNDYNTPGGSKGYLVKQCENCGRVWGYHWQYDVHQGRNESYRDFGVGDAFELAKERHVQ